MHEHNIIITLSQELRVAHKLLPSLTMHEIKHRKNYYLTLQITLV